MRLASRHGQTTLADHRRIAVFARLGSRPIPRVVRMARTTVELGFEPLFLGALRDRDLDRIGEWQGLRIERLGPYFPLLNGRHPYIFLRSVIGYNCALFRRLRRRRPELVHASDIETMPAVALYRFLNRVHLVYNIHDNVAQRYELPSALRAMLNFIEGCCVLRSDVTVVPEDFRRTALPAWCRHKVSVVRNTPGDIAFVPPPAPTDGRIRLFFGGWLDWGRGLRALLAIAESSPRVRLRIAGEGSEDIIRYLKSHPAATYLGFLDQDSVLEETRNSHVVAALYDPARQINRFAASNKLAEALAIGRPVFLNDEMEIARQFAGKSCVISGPYADAVSSWKLVERLLDDWPSYLHACGEARQEYERRYAWAPVHEAMIEALTPDRVRT
jgi:glycosyltransferase involved in cell wall biosynthesis